MAFLNSPALGAAAIIALLANIAAAQPAARHAASASGGGITLRSTSVALPTGDATYPGGKLAEAANNNCLACHSTEMVMTQPKLTRAQWQSEVDKMRSLYKAPVEASDVPAIVDYLSTNPGLGR